MVSKEARGDSCVARLSATVCIRDSQSQKSHGVGRRPQSRFRGPTAYTRRVSEFQVLEGRADLGSERVLLEVDWVNRKHNGGGLAFGPVGMDDSWLARFSKSPNAWSSSWLITNTTERKKFLSARWGDAINK